MEILDLTLSRGAGRGDDSSWIIARSLMLHATFEQWIQVELKVRDRIDLDTGVNFSRTD